MARPRTNIRARIVRAARARFLAKGVDGASLRNIAADAKTNVGMIFYYFPTKDELFLAVVEEVYAKLVDELAQILAGAPRVRDRLEQAFFRLGTMSEDELAVVRLVIREALLSSTRFEQILARSQKGHLPMLLSTLADGVNDREIAGTWPLPVLLVYTMAMGAVPQLLRRGAGHQLPFAALPAPHELARLSADLLFRAIGAPKSPRSRAARSTSKRARLAEDARATRKTRGAPRRA